MKLLTVSLCLCAMMALTQESDGGAPPPQRDEPMTTLPTRIPTKRPYGFRPRCPDRSWRKFNIRCLRYVPKNMTWEAAQANCGGYGLAAALDHSYSEDIVKVLKEAGHPGGQVWVGGCSTDVDWWDWSTFSYMDGQREPTCVQTAPGGNPSGCMTGSQCGLELPSICSWTLM